MISTSVVALMTLILGGAAAYTIYQNGLDVLAGIIMMLPEGGDLPNQVHEAATLFGSYLYSLNWFVPVDTMITILSLTWNIVLGLVVFHLLKTVLNFIRGVNSGRFY